MKTEEEKVTAKSVHDALFKLQGEVMLIVKNKDSNAYRGVRFADLEALTELTRPLLQKYGLVLTQLGGVNSGLPTLVTTLHHVPSETEITSEFMLPYDSTGTEPAFDKQSQIQYQRPVNIVHKFGGAITYISRYAIMRLLGLVAADEDDDANNTSGATRTVNPEELKTIITTANNNRWNKDSISALLLSEYGGIDVTTKLPANKFNDFIASLQSPETKRKYIKA